MSAATTSSALGRMSNRANVVKPRNGHPYRRHWDRIDEQAEREGEAALWLDENVPTKRPPLMGRWRFWDIPLEYIRRQLRHEAAVDRKNEEPWAPPVGHKERRDYNRPAYRAKAWFKILEGFQGTRILVSHNPALQVRTRADVEQAAVKRRRRAELCAALANVRDPVTLDDAARLTGYSYGYIQQAITRGEIVIAQRCQRGVRGSRCLLDPDSLRAFMAKCLSPKKYGPRNGTRRPKVKAPPAQWSNWTRPVVYIPTGKWYESARRAAADVFGDECHRERVYTRLAKGVSFRYALPGEWPTD